MLLEKYTKNSQLSNIMTLGIGTIVAQSINVLIQPILTRLITPEELGVYSFIINIANILIPIASLKLTTLIVISEDKDKADLLTDVSIFTALVVSFLSFLFLIIMLMFENNMFSNIGVMVLVIPLVVATNAIRFIFASHNNREKKYKLMSKTDILREFFRGLLQILSGIVGGGAVGQSIGYAIAPLLGIKIQSVSYLENIKNRERISLSSIFSVYKENINHIVYMVPAQFINSFSYALITFSVFYLYSPTEVGYYAVSYMILGLPLILISNNVGRVYLQNLSHYKNLGKSLWKNYLNFIKFLSFISIIGFIILGLLAPKATELIFGSGYNEAGEYIKILCFMYAFRFIASSVISGYAFFNKQKMDVVFQTLLVLFGLLSHGIAWYYNLNIYYYLSIISLSYGVVYIIIILNLGYISKKFEN